MIYRQDRSNVKAVQDSFISLFNNASVIMSGRCTSVLHDNSFCKAYDSCTSDNHDFSNSVLHNNASGFAYDNSLVECKDHSTVFAYHQSIVFYENPANLKNNNKGVLTFNTNIDSLPDFKRQVLKLASSNHPWFHNNPLSAANQILYSQKPDSVDKINSLLIGSGCTDIRKTYQLFNKWFSAHCSKIAMKAQANFEKGYER
jgi:hypothetical protein